MSSGEHLGVHQRASAYGGADRRNRRSGPSERDSLRICTFALVTCACKPSGVNSRFAGDSLHQSTVAPFKLHIRHCKMSIRHAACEPCRRAKLACGHERPTCARCRGRDQIDLCVYRARPFRRKSHSDRVRERR